MRKFTRRDVAAFLHVSVSTVRRMEGTKLHPERDANGVHRFDIEEIKPLAAEWPKVPTERAKHMTEGRLAAKLFELFDQGLSLSEIVMSTRQPPRVVREHYHEWRTSLDEGEDQRRIEEMDRKDRERDAAISEGWESMLRGMKA